MNKKYNVVLQWFMNTEPQELVKINKEPLSYSDAVMICQHNLFIHNDIHAYYKLKKQTSLNIYPALATHVFFVQEAE